MILRTEWTAWVLLAALAFGAGFRAEALERWAALAQLESGENDRSIGAVGEVSRYQIRPEVWRQYAPARRDWRDPAVALTVARRIMEDRCARFVRSFQRRPTDFEFYVLWNAPAQTGRPGKAVAKRAERYCRLLRRG